MKNMLVIAASAAALMVPATANAQAVPGAVVAVVDLDRVTTTCNACKTAQAALESQVSSARTRAQALGAPLNTEAQAMEPLLKALNGKEPDAALQARIKTYQTKLQAAQQEMQDREEQVRRNQAYVNKQIADKLNPLYAQVMQKRGANILMEVGSTLATSQSIDVTADVLAALNASLTSLVTTAPAAPAQQKPQGR